MTRPSLRSLLQGAGEEAMRECAQRWCGAAKPPQKGGRDVLLAAAAAAMEDEQKALARLTALPKKLQDLLEPFFGEQGSVHSVQNLFAEHGRNFKSRFDLEASLAALHREGFLFAARDKRWASFDGPCWAVPAELVQCVLACRRRLQSALKDVLTLQGFLDARFFRDRAAKAANAKEKANGKRNGKANGDSHPHAKADAGRNGAEDRAADHARKIYKLYTMDGAIAQRLAKLPPPVRAVVDRALSKHGGLAPWDDLGRELDDEDVPDLELVKKCLEETMTGTVVPLELARFGIQPVERCVVVFHEVALQELRRHGEAHPPQVTETLSCGVDFPGNVGRFLRELQASKVLFTAEGDLFKASQKRIAGLLLPVPGELVSPDALLELLYRFCLHRRLIDRRGERALRPTPAGNEFDRAPLQEQVKLLLSHFVEDRSLPGEPFHQTRLRRVLLRLLRRAEPMQWQELSILPFLARNAYLAQLDTAQAEEFFAARFQGGGYTPTESLQQMAWNLLTWVKKRLCPLGLVDVGKHGGRPTALRLSKLGAELLDAEPSGRVVPQRSTVLVNPDYEILLFPGDDVHEAVHVFDRFARRLKSDHVHQFRLDETSVRAGLADGLTLAQILQELNDRARAPVPQNVRYSLEEWAGP